MATQDAGKSDDRLEGNNLIFHCPECRHKLNGPASLQGKPGQCPRCKSKFLIPVLEQKEPATPEKEQERPKEDEIIDVGDDGLDSLEDADLEDLEDIEDLEVGEPVPEPNHGPPSGPDVFFPSPGNSEFEAHPLGQIFLTLWQEREHGGVVEIHLGDGVVLIPDWWATDLSQASHALFAQQANDGSYVMECVPWDGVKRITVRRISELPDGVFE